MIAVNQLINEIEKLPSEYLQDIMDFIDYLRLKQVKNVSETMIMSEKSLDKYWNTPEEDEAWANL
ncbi:MAG: DUF2281 domain-containing protein [Oscillospiraceae bacterium]|nr:DUF2281 domain-containing protein [Oscillospiraceae bacterium]